MTIICVTSNRQKSVSWCIYCTVFSLDLLTSHYLYLCELAILELMFLSASSSEARIYELANLNIRVSIWNI